MENSSDLLVNRRRFLNLAAGGAAAAAILPQTARGAAAGGKTKLITFVDDVGTFHTVNRAVRDILPHGLLRNVAIIAAGPWFDEAVEYFRDRKEICLGLHAAATCEWNEMRWRPILGREKVPSLVMKDGTFFKDDKSFWANRPKVDEILAELQAQLDLARSKGLNVEFMDWHMLFPNGVPGLKERLQDFVRREGLATYFWEDLPRTGAPVVNWRAGNSPDYVERLLAALAKVEPGKTYMLMSEPAYDDEERRATSHPGKARGVRAKEDDWGRRIFMDPRVVRYYREHELEPIRITEWYAHR